MQHVLYRCNKCFIEWAERRPDGDALEDNPACACSGVGKWFHVRFGVPDEPDVVNKTPDVFVKGKSYTFDKRFQVHSQHASRGMKAGAYKRNTRDVQRREILRQREIDKAPCGNKADTPRFLGSMSMEMATSIGLQEGDPNVVLRDPKHFLKATGRNTD